MSRQKLTHEHVSRLVCMICSAQFFGKGDTPSAARKDASKKVRAHIRSAHPVGKQKAG